MGRVGKKRINRSKERKNIVGKGVEMGEMATKEDQTILPRMEWKWRNRKMEVLGKCCR